MLGASAAQVAECEGRLGGSRCRRDFHAAGEPEPVDGGQPLLLQGLARLLPGRREGDAEHGLGHPDRGLDAGGRLEREVPGPGQRRVRRRDRLSLAGGCHRPGGRDGWHGHGSLRWRDGRELGARAPREGDRLRVPRHPRDDADRQSHDRGALRQHGPVLVFRKLLERRAAGADGGAAFPRGLRRHPRGRAGQRLDAPADEGAGGHAGDDPRGGELHPLGSFRRSPAR